MSDRTPRPSAPRPSRARHFGGFLAAGILALITDGLVLTVLIDAAGLDPLVARLLSISAAMVVSWLVNRTVTFAVTETPTLAEFGQFAAVSWTAQAVNYALFAAILLIWPGTLPLVALVLASLVSMLVSYAGFRYGVFRNSRYGAP